MAVLAFLGIAGVISIFVLWILNPSDPEQFCEDLWVSLTKLMESSFPKKASAAELEYLQELCTSLESTGDVVNGLLVNVRKAIAEEIELEKTTEAALARKNEFVSKWHERATNAVHEKNDVLAKQALHKKALYQREVQTYEHVLEDTRKSLNSLRDHLLELEALSAHVRNKTNILALRARLAIKSIQAHRNLATAHRHQAMVSVEQATRANRNHTDEKFMTASRHAMRSFSKLFENIENEISLMERQAAQWARGADDKTSSDIDKEAIERELDQLKKNEQG